ncbi:MAG: siderophore-interacting protein [Marmoricola sp.]|nr:siderophore-interacting protein [Marmoricola sp.]
MQQTPEETQQVNAAPSVLLTEATVHSVARLSPAFVRVAFASRAFPDLGVDGFDTRFKIVFPGGTGELPPIPEVADDYYDLWMSAPEEVRSPMRTYTIRDVVRDGEDVRLVVDFVVHEDRGHGQGPACRWALGARPGDAVHVIAPHRLTEYGGTEFDPGERRHVLLIGDETAVPALTRILADLRPGHTAEVFIEVPSGDDLLDLHVPPGVEVKWFSRNQDACGRRLVQEVRRHLGLPPSKDFEVLPELTTDLDIDVWETPRYSAVGEDLASQLHTRSLGHDLDDTYAWIAGESWMVRALRRSLVSELGVDRSQVAFMGYWREGVAMKS